MTRMATKSDIGGYEAARHPCPKPREVGGGVNPSSRDLEGCGVGRSWKDEGMRLDTQPLNHLSPRGLVGFFFRAISP